jgi:hypothetical protein
MRDTILLAITEYLRHKEADRFHGSCNYVDLDDFDDAILDGHFNLVTMAEAVEIAVRNHILDVIVKEG